MTTCIIEYRIDPYKHAEFERYAHNWATAIPRCGAELLGYFLAEEGTRSRAFGIYSIADLAAYEAYRKQLKDDPVGKENFEFAQRDRFILSEERAFYRAIGGSASA
ncbi:NIPSNAP family protein [Qipengyuania sp. YG27]|uniref:NIPSNAP family protein n=1 Tax=Qipengyuania mesophila TaxID=2867246 RepID=A0ABS7JRD7_9SPHN|nr:NIPSNAP family protein [Qipengyuania mesophila]MBX7500207.1 NIPSNAP family protein [Qipengyuania mesophila]